MKKIKTEIYSRISGYYRPVQQWNKGKQSEFGDRVNLKIPEVKNEILDKNIQV
jgi:anaerobic ribonucleoside-triphosphate reductase